MRLSRGSSYTHRSLATVADHVKVKDTSADDGDNARRIAVADLFGRSAGDIVNSVWKDVVDRTGAFWWWWWWRSDDEFALEVDGLIDEMARELAVSVSACVITCLSFAWKYASFKRSRKLVWWLRRTSHAKFKRVGTVRLGALSPFCAHMRLIRSAMCCIVGACVVECKWIGRRLPGGSPRSDKTITPRSRAISSVSRRRGGSICRGTRWRFCIRSRSRFPTASAQRFSLRERIVRSSSGICGPWYGSNVRLRFRGGCFGTVGGGGVGGLLRVAVASKREMIKALCSCTI